MLATGLLMAAVLAALYPVSRKSCLSAWHDYNPTFSLWEGCRIEYNGRRIPTDAVKRVEISQ